LTINDFGNIFGASILFNGTTLLNIAQDDSDSLSPKK